MRTVVAPFICLCGLASLACAAAESTAPLPTYHLRGYYSIREENAVWQFSDNSPWQVVANEPWIDPKLVKWGYVPLTHNSKHYYCLIDDKPITGSNIAKKTFICGDAGIMRFGYTQNWRPTLRLYGPDHY
jgi:hypothetical protein